MAGYVDDEKLVSTPEPAAIMFGDHTRRIKYVDFPFVLGADGVKVLQTTAEMDPKFGFHFLSSIKLPDGGYSRHFKFLRDVQVPLPPLSEQRRIALILDNVAVIRGRRLAAIRALDELVWADFRDLHTGSWRSRRLDEIGQWAAGGTPSRSEASNFVGRIPWVTSGELGPLRLDSTREFISEIALAGSNAKRVPVGAVMLGMYDTAALKSSIAAVELACNQAVAFGVLGPTVLPEYVYYAIQSQRPQILNRRRGIRQKNLNLTMVRDIEIPIPPLEVQRSFVDRVTAIGSVERLERLHLALLDELFASLQHRAFTGQL